MMDYLPQLMLAWSIQLSWIATPGPGVALVLGVAAAQGRRPALVTALGIACGSTVLAVATVLGIAALLAQAAGLMTLVRLIGAAYLLWLAFGAFRKAVAPPEMVVARVGGSGALRTARRGFLLQISNPKAILGWLAIAAVGGTGAAPLPVVAVFVAGAFVNSFVGHGLWGLVFSARPMRAAYARALRPIEAALGAFYTFAAYRLATARS